MSTGICLTVVGVCVVITFAFVFVFYFAENEENQERGETAAYVKLKV